MKKPVEDPAFWRQRLVEAHALGKTVAQAVWDTWPENWERMQGLTAELLAWHVRAGWRVLDAGCGHGSLAGLLPPVENLTYVGVDVSPEMVQTAALLNKDDLTWATFEVANLRDLSRYPAAHFDLVVARSLRRMVRDNVGPEAWAEINRELERVGKRLLLIEYDDEFEHEMVAVKNSGKGGPAGLFRPRAMTAREKAVHLACGVDGWMSSTELGWLFDRAGEVPPGGTWVEVGTWKGRSALATALGLSHGSRLVCVDKFNGVAARHAEHAWEGGLKICGEPWLLQCFRLVKMLVQEVRRDVGVNAIPATSAVADVVDLPLDAVFLDADHEYEGVKEDLERWSARLRPGGLLCGHDYHPEYQGVVRAVDEFCGDRLERGPGTIWWRRP